MSGVGPAAVRKQRLFIGVPVPRGAIAFVQEAQKALAGLPGLRQIKEDQLHVTLGFIGEVDGGKASAAGGLGHSRSRWCL